jgi:hypothetical protein
VDVGEDNKKPRLRQPGQLARVSLNSAVEVARQIRDMEWRWRRRVKASSGGDASDRRRGRLRHIPDDAHDNPVNVDYDQDIVQVENVRFKLVTGVPEQDSTLHQCFPCCFASSLRTFFAYISGDFKFAELDLDSAVQSTVDMATAGTHKVNRASLSAVTRPKLGCLIESEQNVARGACFDDGRAASVWHRLALRTKSSAVTAKHRAPVARLVTRSCARAATAGRGFPVARKRATICRREVTVDVCELDGPRSAVSRARCGRHVCDENFLPRDPSGAVSS